MPETLEDMRRKIDKRLEKFAEQKKYPPADNGFWRGWADELFMEPYRGTPCIVCGRTSTQKKVRKRNSQEMVLATFRTGFHHLIPKDGCFLHRYTKRNGAILCSWHHTDCPDLSPHYQYSAMANHRFWLFIMQNNSDLYDWVVAHENDTPESLGLKKCWTYRDALIYQYHRHFRELPNVKPAAIKSAREWQHFFSKGELPESQMI